MLDVVFALDGISDVVELPEIDPITRAFVNPEFSNSFAHCSTISKISSLNSLDPRDDNCRSF